MTRTDLLTEVVKAVAAAEGVAPGQIEPLHDYIDPDVLNKLDGMKNEHEWRFTFQYGDHQITIGHDSRVLVDGEFYRSERSV
ncbi:HalOD1 output domain-containing protein [Halobellus litoreus]|uniref:HalOD1 output domain-containing protein n=1 Tax=Halobellus litoreus TaxID=755310 RepID=A0ABD6DWW5_9EURY|nr:HalOD1 output domain-containing protein [Halobellus litoreus]